jgi:hypothetical protein
MESPDQEDVQRVLSVNGCCSNGFGRPPLGGIDRITLDRITLDSHSRVSSISV